MSNALVAPLVGEFQRRSPQLRLRVLASYEPVETTHDYFDIGLQYGRWGEEKFLIEPIADEVISRSVHQR